VTRLWVGRLGLISDRDNYGICFSPWARPCRHWGPPTIQWVGGFPSQGEKRPRRESDHSPQSSAEVKNAWSYTSTPQCVFMAWCLVKHRDNFTFSPFPLLIKYIPYFGGNSKPNFVIFSEKRAHHKIQLYVIEKCRIKVYSEQYDGYLTTCKVQQVLTPRSVISFVTVVLYFQQWNTLYSSYGRYMHSKLEQVITTFHAPLDMLMNSSTEHTQLYLSRLRRKTVVSTCIKTTFL
jgi:hypothetical protein